MTAQPTIPDATDRTGPAPAAHDHPSVPPALVDRMSRGWDETDEASALRPLECAEHTARRRESRTACLTNCGYWRACHGTATNDGLTEWDVAWRFALGRRATTRPTRGSYGAAQCGR